jgi:hypothetical protein
MNVGCMITNGGPHPPAKWASVTAAQIIDIASSGPATLLAEARAFQAKIEGLLAGHHGLAQSHERAALAAEGTQRLAGDIDTGGHVPDAVDDILAAARGTSFAAHFAQPQVQAYLRRLLHEHFHHSMWIERSWHADAHPDHAHAKAFRAAQFDGHQALMLTDEEIAAFGGHETMLAMVRNAVPGTPKSEG